MFFHVQVWRIGEALHPGPFVIRTFNPAQLLGHENDICSWPDGIWTASETSHTPAAMGVLQRRFHKHDVHTAFSQPVEKHSGNAGAYRGKAMGTAILSRFPLAPYPMDLDDDVKMSSRFSDAVVKLGSGMDAYVCVVYAPPINNYTYADGEKVFLNAILPGLQRASHYKGPAVITGDFNRDLDDCAFWQTLRSKGWYDCAELAWFHHNKIPEPTCKDSSRRSFILVNAVMARYFRDCGTVEHHMFDAHPVLEATFEIQQGPNLKQVWSLPRSLDGLLFDKDALEIHCNNACHSRSSKFHDALRKGDANLAMIQFALTFEDMIRHSAVDVEGNTVHVPAACFKRCRNKVVKQKEVTAQAVRRGRDGDFRVSIGQVTRKLKCKVTQCRRLLSLCRQLKARERNATYENLSQCTMLWKAICAAPGFHKGFQTWILDVIGWFVPALLPERAYVEGLYAVLHDMVQKEVREERYEQLRMFNKISLEDVAKGGGMAFKAVRERSAPPPTFMSHDVHQKLLRQRWTLGGTQRLRYKRPCILEKGLPVCFQGQQAILCEVDDDFLYLDRPVKCKSMNDLVLAQPKRETDAKQMQTMVCDAWNQFWQAPDVVTPEAEEFVRGMSDCPSCPYMDFQVDTWRRCIKGVKVKSARGACGFSMRDMQLMPNQLVEWLFMLYRAIEAGMPWPSRLTLARVTMLAKPGEDNHRPTSVRPITIVSVIYRLWSRFRSLQVIQHLGAMVPPQIGGIAARLSADCLNALVCDLIEEAHETGNHRCGLVIDLKKCFNLVPRSTLARLMEKLELPAQYVIAHQGMLKGLKRLVEVAGQVGSEQDSTCGVPEGCAFSVAAMVALTILAAEVMQNGCNGIDIVMYADNWGLTATSVEMLVNAISRLERLVTSLGMTISPEKSWVWGTSPSIRRQLRQVRLNGQTVSVKLSAKDLGCDVSYSKRKCKLVAKKRLNKAVATLQRVKGRRLPRKFKGRMCATLGAGIAGFGSEFHKHTKQENHRLRSATAEALGLYRSGANAWLAINATGQFSDPQLQLVKRKIKFFRRYLRIFHTRRESFLNRLVNRSWKSGAGMTKQLASTFNEIGWSWRNKEVMEHECGLQMRWLEDSVPFVMRTLQKAWTWYVSNQIKRPMFDVQTFDSQSFFKSMRDKPLWHQGILQTYACGKHVTNDGLVHYAERAETAQCVFCGKDDSKFHRLFQCQGLADLHRKHHDTLKWVKKQKQAVWAFCLFPDVGNPFQVKKHLQVRRPFNMPCPMPVRKHVYTDGSAFFNTHWDCCLAGSAVVEWKQEQGEMVEVVRRILPYQDHSSYRAEVFAVVLALEMFWCVDIFSDCEAVVSQFEAMCDAIGRKGNIILGQHADLWSVVERHLRQRECGAVRMFKVKAHVSDTSTLPEDLRIHAWGNQQADCCAKDAVRIDHVALHRKMEGIVIERTAVYQKMCAFQNVLVDMCDRYLESRPRKVELVACPDLVTLTRVSGETFMLPCMSHEYMMSCPYTTAFAERFQQWIRRVHWGDGEPFSCLEMYITFALDTGMMAPVQIKDKVYALRTESVAADQFRLDLSRQSRVWINFLQWWLQGIESPIQLQSMKALRHVGFPIAVKCFLKRPRLVGTKDALATLWRYFQQTVGTHKTLSKPWSVQSPISAAGGA